MRSTQLLEIGADRVWITTEDRAALLDFRAPATPPTPARAVRDAASLQGFLAEVAKSTVTPLRPLHARTLLETLAAGRLEAPEIVAGNLRAALTKPAAVSTRRRLFTLTLGPLVAPALGLVLCGIVPVENRRFDTWWQQRGRSLDRRALELRSGGLGKEMEDPLDRHRGLSRHFADDDAFGRAPGAAFSGWIGSSRELLRTNPASASHLRSCDADETRVQNSTVGALRSDHRPSGCSACFSLAGARLGSESALRDHRRHSIGLRLSASRWSGATECGVAPRAAARTFIASLPSRRRAAWTRSCSPANRPHPKCSLFS